MPEKRDIVDRLFPEGVLCDSSAITSQMADNRFRRFLMKSLPLIGYDNDEVDRIVGGYTGEVR